MMIETFSMVSAMSCLSDAAAGFGDTGDLRGDLGRPLREQLVQLLDRDTGRLAEHSHGWARALAQELRAHEADDRPVRVRELVDAFAPCELGNHLLGPLT